MLPPDKENKSVFTFFTESNIYQSIKSLVKNPYDEKMLKKYCSSTIEAMFYELIHVKNSERQFLDHQRALKYIHNIHISVTECFKNVYSYYYEHDYIELNQVSLKYYLTDIYN